MTRKRKNVEGGEEAHQKPTFEQYGYVNEPSQEPTQRREYPEKRGFFPKKGRDDGYRSRQSTGDFQKDIDKKYGTVGGDGPTEFEKRDGTRGDFPKELVSYLKSIDTMRKQEGKLEDFIIEKCGQEVVGMEVTLLEWTEAAVIVESVFGSSPLGAFTFLSAICRLKHKQLLNLIFSGMAARTIENLIYAMCPIGQLEHAQIVDKFSELICEKWSEAVVEKSSSFLLRCIIRVTAGLSAPLQPVANNGYNNKFAPKPQTNVVKFANNEMKAELKKVFERISLLAFDPVLNQELEENPICSLVLQEVVEADALLKTRHADSYIGKILEKEDAGERITASWKGINRSRIWEKLMDTCREETRTAVWMTISQNVAGLAADQYANFPLQKLIGAVSSLELATEVVEDLAPSTADLMGNRRDGVVRCVLRCAAKHEELQEKMIKTLRGLYRANKVSNKTHFLYNVLTSNAFDGEHFDVNKCTVQGSLLVEELLKFTKVKTLSSCIEAMSAETLVQLATHKVGAHVIQAFLVSPTLPKEVKSKIVESFEEHWHTIINDVYGSHVFEKVFFSFADVKKKQEIMKKLVGIRSDTKFWKFAMVQCDLYLFRKDRKAWVEKMKQQKSRF